MRNPLVDYGKFVWEILRDEYPQDDIINFFNEEIVPNGFSSKKQKYFHVNNSSITPQSRWGNIGDRLDEFYGDKNIGTTNPKDYVLGSAVEYSSGTYGQKIKEMYVCSKEDLVCSWVGAVYSFYFKKNRFIYYNAETVKDFDRCRKYYDGFLCSDTYLGRNDYKDYNGKLGLMYTLFLGGDDELRNGISDGTLPYGILMENLRNEIAGSFFIYVCESLIEYHKNLENLQLFIYNFGNKDDIVGSRFISPNVLNDLDEMISTVNREEIYSLLSKSLNHNTVINNTLFDRIIVNRSLYGVLEQIYNNKKKQHLIKLLIKAMLTEEQIQTIEKFVTAVNDQFMDRNNNSFYNKWKGMMKFKHIQRETLIDMLIAVNEHGDNMDPTLLGEMNGQINSLSEKNIPLYYKQMRFAWSMINKAK